MTSSRYNCSPLGTTATTTLSALLLASGACRSQTTTVASAAPIPHERAAVAKAAPWTFEPATDAFRPTALLDLRSLNEKVAGENGFIVRTPEGDFATANGKPIRFWGLSEYIQDKDDDPALAHKARWLAKRGVNIVRVHTQIAPDKPDAKLTDVNEKAVDRVWRLVAAMKKEGIYTTISPYWGVHVKAQSGWGVTGMSGKELPAILFWDKTLQTGYKAWLKALYSRPNPHTSIPLSQDPSVAIIQLQNEDSILFWTIGQVTGEALTGLRTTYADWLKQKYGSLEKANAAWGGDQPAVGEFQDKQGDEFATGRAGVYIIWFMTRDGQKQVPAGSYKAKRLADQLAFYTETMRKFNTEMAAYLRNDLGCKQLINAGNWRPADPTLLFDAERYSYTANDVQGVNRYFDGIHEGKDNGWAIRHGDRFTSNSVLIDPRGMPTNIKQPVGQPFIIPETEWVSPNLYQSEGPFLTAAYQSLTGVDISYFFADGDVPEWQPPFMVAPWNPPAGKWSVATPMQLGQFPAAALMFRNGYLKKGKPVVHEERALDDLWTLKTPLIAEEGGWDPNRDAGNPPPRSAVKGGIDPLAFLVGPVEVKYGGDPAKSTALDLAPYIDSAKKTVVSNTGEIRLNYGVGICVVNAPKAQGVTGFLAKASGPIALSDITIRSSNEYATVSVTSMDDLPIKSSKKLLVQMGTVARPTGWEDKDATWESGKVTRQGKVIVATGKNPWTITPNDVTVTVKNPSIKTATILNANGEAAGTVPLTHEVGGVTLTLPPDTLYLVLQ